MEDRVEDEPHRPASRASGAGGRGQERGDERPLGVGQARRVGAGLARKLRAPYYSGTRRPSVDPELMLRMLLVGYLRGIRSERRLGDEVHLNLAYR